MGINFYEIIQTIIFFNSFHLYDKYNLQMSHGKMQKGGECIFIFSRKEFGHDRNIAFKQFKNILQQVKINLYKCSQKNYKTINQL